MALINTPAPARWRRLMPVALLAAAGALGGSALANPAVACAAPNTGGGYDDGRYEECRNSGLNPRFCCSQAGGTWTKVTVYDKNGYPVSSYYMCTGSAQPQPAVSQPPVTRVPPGVIQPLTPQTFEPVSAA